MTEHATTEHIKADAEMCQILEELLAADIDISARAVARKHSSIKAASSITRHDSRRALLTQYQERQRAFRQWLLRLPKRSRANIAADMALKDNRIKELEKQVELLTASHLALIRTVGELGGFSKWTKFYDNYAEARRQLETMNALQVTTILPIR